VKVLELWDKVHQAAAAGNIKEMLAILYESGFLDGLERKMHFDWPRVPIEDIDNMVIAAAVDDLYSAIGKGKVIYKPGAYLYKAAKNRAIKFTQQQQSILEDLIRESRVVDSFEDPFEERIEPLDDEYLLGRAIQEARRLLPKLGQENVQRVMSYVLDCIAARVIDVSPTEIAESLGLLPGTVSVNLHRGFDRLKRVATEENLADLIINEATLLNVIEGESGVG
jgi:DNA-directed RNA polymerase specialized sigma24 family protein